MNRLRSWRYRVVDVFTREPLQGNPLAVFLDASGIDGATMQKIAREMNLSETVFVLPATRADCLVSVRIFTPARELPFAGHPTIGTSFVLRDEGIVPKMTEQFLLEEKVGPVPIRIETGEQPLIWLRTPPITWGRIYDRALCAKALGLDVSDLLEITPQLLSAGNPTLLIALKDKPSVDRAWLDSHGLSVIRNDDDEALCVFVFTPMAEGAYSRMFAPEYGVQEDPATGSSTGPLAAFMIKHGLASSAAGGRFLSEQGTKMGRRSVLYVQINGAQGADAIDVGGYVTPVAEGTMHL
ncbi:MAG TPA: PhzF family phenazine biosynthesis protein [Pyrinomonadaceae bacterium]|nr:PhzF family phenazine biosynthesis protein [Pyrinomonadaceae bacterium]